MSKWEGSGESNRMGERINQETRGHSCYQRQEGESKDNELVERMMMKKKNKENLQDYINRIRDEYIKKYEEKFGKGENDEGSI